MTKAFTVADNLQEIRLFLSNKEIERKTIQNNVHNPIGIRNCTDEKTSRFQCVTRVSNEISRLFLCFKRIMKRKLTTDEIEFYIKFVQLPTKVLKITERGDLILPYSNLHK